MPRLPKAPQPKRNPRQEALDRLFITDEDLKAIPRITGIWKAAEGGVKQVIEALRSSEDETAIQFLAKYDSLTPTDRKLLSIEEIAVSCQISTKRLHEVASSSLLEVEDQAAALMLATSKRKLIKTSLRAAMKEKGWSDRENMLKSTGILPTPKGSTLNIPLTFNTANVTQNLPAPEMKTAEQRLEIVQRAFEKKRLEAPKEPVVIPAVDENLSRRQEALRVLAQEGS